VLITLLLLVAAVVVLVMEVAVVEVVLGDLELALHFLFLMVKDLQLLLVQVGREVLAPI